MAERAWLLLAGVPSNVQQGEWQPVTTEDKQGTQRQAQSRSAALLLVLCLLVSTKWLLIPWALQEDLDLLQKLSPLAPVAPLAHLPAIKKAATQPTGFLVAKLCFYVNPIAFSLELNRDRPPPLK